MYCVSCGTQLPDEANFCWKCGKPQKSGIRADEPQWEICEIDWRSIKIKSGGLFGLGDTSTEGYYFATAIGPKGQYEVAKSKTFHVLGYRPASDTPDEHLQALISQLVNNGWEPQGRKGNTRYDYSFRRRIK